MREGFHQITLEEVCSKTSNIKWQDYLNNTFEYIDLSSVSRESLIITETTTINSKTAPSRAKKIVFENDVIFATTRPTLKRVTLVTRQYHKQICSTGFCVLRANKDIIVSKLIKYFIQSESFINRMQSLERGASYPAVSDKDVFETKLTIPKSLHEQQQIVAIIDQAFEAIDQAKANIEKNIANAKELFQSKLNAIFSQKGEGWEEKKLEDISSVINGYSFKSNDFSADNEIKSIKITNVGIMEFVEDFSNNLPSSFSNDYSKVKVHEGDLVLALTRTIISGGLKVARVPKSYHHALLNQRVAAIVPNIEKVDSDYLYYYFSSTIVYNYVLDNVNTLMQPNLSIGDLKRMKVPITTIERQKAISIQIENLSENTILLINNYGIKLTNLEDLKKSILQKAFAGELTKATVLQQVTEPMARYSKN